MLVLSRRAGERIQIGDGVFITLLSIQGQTARVGIEAPREIPIRRQEFSHRSNLESAGQALCARYPR